MRATAPSGSPAGSTIAGAVGGVCGGMGQGVGAEIWPVELVDWGNAGLWLAVFCLRQTPGPTGLQFKLCCP